MTSILNFDYNDRKRNQLLRGSCRSFSVFINGYFRAVFFRVATANKSSLSTILKNMVP